MIKLQGNEGAREVRGGRPTSLGGMPQGTVPLFPRGTCNGEVQGEALKLPATDPLGLEADGGEMEYRHIQWKPLP